MRVRVLLVLGLMLLAGCASNEAPQPAMDEPTPCGALDQSFQIEQRYEPRVRLETSNGTIEFLVFANQVPFTASHFLSLVEQGFYDDTRFHQLQADTLIRGGDPFTRGTNKDFWGTGGSGASIPDEFHAFLRHDRPGIVSISSELPNKGDSQFTIHLEARPDLDDRDTVIGRVTEGLDVVQEISNTMVDDRNRPQFHARIRSAELVVPPADPSEAPVALSSFGYDCDRLVEPGETAALLAVVRNTGQRVLNGTFEHDAPEGWAVSLRNAERVVVPSGQSVAYIVDVTTPETLALGASQNLNVTFADTDSEASTSLQFTLEGATFGPSPEPDDEVAVSYVGVLEDGRPFDTTQGIYTGISSLRWFKPPPSHLEPLPFTLDDGRLIPGFDDLADRAQLGQTVVASVPPEQGYGQDSWGRTNLGGRLLFFHVTLVEVNGQGLGSQT